jgi:hypothetical protein
VTTPPGAPASTDPGQPSAGPPRTGGTPTPYHRRTPRQHWHAFINSRDDYGPALLLIVATIGARAIFGDHPVGIFIGVVLGGLTLVFVFNTSDASPRLVRSAGLLVAVAVVVSGSALVVGVANPRMETIARELSSLIGLILAVVAPVVIFRRIATRPTITFPMVLGALSVYLLFGLAYSYVFSLITALQGMPFFVQANADNPTTYIYFSYVTMTTVGYGDFTAATDIGRIVAVSEALLGQLYLVSVVALLVGNLGRTRTPTEVTKLPDEIL